MQEVENKSSGITRTVRLSVATIGAFLKPHSRRDMAFLYSFPRVEFLGKGAVTTAVLGALKVSFCGIDLFSRVRGEVKFCRSS